MGFHHKKKKGPSGVKHKGHKRPRMQSYSDRNQVLKDLGFRSYQDYLRSDLWASIRDHSMALSSVCVGCHGKATQIHHGRYRRCDLDGTCMSMLFPVCGACHRYIEFGSRDGHKLSVEQATAKLKGMTAQPSANENPIDSPIAQETSPAANRQNERKARREQHELDRQLKAISREKHLNRQQRKEEARRVERRCIRRQTDVAYAESKELFKAIDTDKSNAPPLSRFLNA